MVKYLKYLISCINLLLIKKYINIHLFFMLFISILIFLCKIKIKITLVGNYVHEWVLRVLDITMNSCNFGTILRVCLFLRFKNVFVLFFFNFKLFLCFQIVLMCQCQK
jgi:hypothetical protein